MKFFEWLGKIVPDGRTRVDKGQRFINGAWCSKLWCYHGCHRYSWIRSDAPVAAWVCPDCFRTKGGIPLLPQVPPDLEKDLIRGYGR